MCSIAVLGECVSSGRRRTSTPFAAWSSKPFASPQSASVPIAGCQTIGTSSCGPIATAICHALCSEWPTCTPNVGNVQNSASAMGTSIKGVSNRFRSIATSISIRSCDTWNATPYGLDLFSARRIGHGEVCTNVRARQPGRRCAIGRCRSRPTGWSTSIRRRRKQRLRRSDDAFVVAVLTATPSGPSRQPNSWAFNPPSVVAAGPPKNVHESIAVYPVYATVPFISLYLESC
jgi:hypothetical protein